MRQLGKDRTGVRKLYNARDGASFAAAWDADLVRFQCALKITCGRCGNANTVSGL